MLMVHVQGACHSLQSACLPLCVTPCLHVLKDVLALSIYCCVFCLVEEGKKVMGVARGKLVQHPVKGGYMITDYLTYDWYW